MFIMRLRGEVTGMFLPPPQALLMFAFGYFDSPCAVVQVRMRSYVIAARYSTLSLSSAPNGRRSRVHSGPCADLQTPRALWV
jgi:hypothetical protein